MMVAFSNGKRSRGVDARRACETQTRSSLRPAPPPHALTLSRHGAREPAPPPPHSSHMLLALLSCLWRAAWGGGVGGADERGAAFFAAEDDPYSRGVQVGNGLI